MMHLKIRKFFSDPGTVIYYQWAPDAQDSPKGVVQVVHGMMEHARRYEGVARALCDAGYVVVAHDQKGHGATAEVNERLGRLQPDGWSVLQRDVLQLRDIIDADFPDLPVFLCGHSMGSFLCQSFDDAVLGRYRGLILSGTTIKSRLLLQFSLGLAAFVRLFISVDQPSYFFQRMSFSGFNRGFESETPFDWLCSDRQVVQDYVHDPLCGMCMSWGFYAALMRGMLAAHQRVRRFGLADIPVLCVSGGQDPLNEGGKRVEDIVRYCARTTGQVVETVTYDTMRHEVFQEADKGKVLTDMIAWIQRVPASST